MKVLFVLPRMVSGGVERVTLSLMKGISDHGHRCELALSRAYGELLNEAKSLAPVHELAPHGLHQFVPRLSGVIQRIQPTHIVTAFHDVAALGWLAMKLSGHRAKWVHGVHNTHSTTAALPGITGAAKHWLFNRCAGFVYRRANAVVTVSEGVRSEVLELYDVDPTKVVTIYNPVVADISVASVGEPMRNRRHPFLLVALGRLAHQKGFDVLIEAMGQVPPPWKLEIWGEGPERQHLESLIDENGFQDAIFLIGHTSNPFEKLSSADLFVLPSRHEGLPTVLIEALACSCQIVATDCPHGPNEILENGRLGTLVKPEDAKELAAAIRSAIEKRFWVEPSLLIQRARDFTVGTATENWLHLLQG